MPHPDEGRIHAWLDGELDAVEAARVEALVAADPQWAAAAAEARGLIAATSRITRALDSVPANVIPKAKPPARAPGWWRLRVAAMLIVVAGAATVLSRVSPYSAMRVATQPTEAAPVAPATPLAQQGTRAAAPGRPGVTAPGDKLEALAKARPFDKEKREAAPLPPALAGDREARRDERKAELPLLDKTTASLDAKRQNAAGAVQAQAEKDQAAAARLQSVKAAPPPAAAPAAAAAAARTSVAGGSVVAASPSALSAKVAELSASTVRCFELQPPIDSAGRILRFSASALADSERIGALHVRGDSLVGVSRRLVGLAVRCPER